MYGYVIACFPECYVKNSTETISALLYPGGKDKVPRRSAISNVCLRVSLCVSVYVFA